MRINRIALEVVGESSDEELVEHTALVHVEVVRNLIVAPACQVAWVVVGRIETVASRKADSIRQDNTGNGISRLTVV